MMGGSTTFTMLYTTKKFRDENPLTYKAIVRALKDAIDYINRDKRGAAQVYFDSIGGKGETIEGRHDDTQRPEKRNHDGAAEHV